MTSQMLAQGTDRHYFIFVVNTGSTSTKLALYRNEDAIASTAIGTDPGVSSHGESIWSQFDSRCSVASEWLRGTGERPSAVAAIGGLLRPVPGGTYIVNERMLADARTNLQGEHASNMACAIAFKIAGEAGCPAFVADPVSVDEFEPLARYSGHPLIERRSLSHALNIHAAARMAAEKSGKKLSETNWVVAHLGGGISVAPVRHGRIIDANDASSDGPFSPERTGGLPLQQFIGLCFSGNYGEKAMREMVMGRGGLAAYLGTNSAREVEARILSGDEKAREVYRAMAYQVAKEIGAMSTVFADGIDAVILTGGLTKSAMLIQWIEERVKFIAPVYVFAGENEMKTLALGALRVLRGLEKAMEY